MAPNLECQHTLPTRYSSVASHIGKMLNLLWQKNAIGHIAFDVNGQLQKKSLGHPGHTDCYPRGRLYSLKRPKTNQKRDGVSSFKKTFMTDCFSVEVAENTQGEISVYGRPPVLYSTKRASLLILSTLGTKLLHTK